MENPSSSIYKIKVGEFEGPLDLLLSLIKQRKFFINEVSLAQVTDEYIAYIKKISEIPREKQIADISYFILVAATLILIKSKSLLPNLDLTKEETEKITDLEKRLKIYQIIKEASLEVKDNFGLKIIFTPVDRAWDKFIFVPDKNITNKNIKQAIGQVLTHMPKPLIKKPTVRINKIINIDEVIDDLTHRVQNAMNLSFQEFAQSHGSENKEEARIHIIVSFLAMLELVREGIVDVIQNSSFGDIKINKQVLIEK